MSYTNANWACVSGSLNQGQLTVTPFGGSSTVENAQNVFAYASPNDAVATIGGANYFLVEYASLCVGDWILVNGTDASEILIVDTVSSTSVTTVGFSAAGTVNTADIVNNAVTYAKFQQVAASSLVGNPTGGLANAEGITIGNGLEFTGTVLDVPSTNLIYTNVAISASEFLNMYATPKLLLASPGANKVIVVDKLVLVLTHVSTNYAAGGVVGAQYDQPAHLAGVLASNTEAAADFFASGSTTYFFNGASGNSSQAVNTVSSNKGLYLSNATGAFTNGDSTFVAHIWYKVIPTA